MAWGGGGGGGRGGSLLRMWPSSVQINGEYMPGVCRTRGDLIELCAVGRQRPAGGRPSQGDMTAHVHVRVRSRHAAVSQARHVMPLSNLKIYKGPRRV